MNPKTLTTLKRWAFRLVIVIVSFVALLLLVVLPIGASFLITNSRFRFPERGAKSPQSVGLSVIDAEFSSSDGIPLRGWWDAGRHEMPVIIFVHGLNRSRLEFLDRAADAQKRGYGVLLFDLRNHGESGKAYTTIGVFESRDVCAASKWVRDKAGADRPQILWGVSMGASSAILAAKQCPGFAAIISDSSFLSFRDTIAHHLTLFFRLPAFPIANLIVTVTAFRMGFNPDDGDVETAIQNLHVPIMFIAGTADKRMPPALAERMFQAARDPKELLIIPGATHGEAFAKDRERYLNSIYRFLETVRYNPAALHRSGGS